jgi:GxxExxY protein
MNENELATIIVDAAFTVHKALGPGLLESVYEGALAHELTKRGLTVHRQSAIPVIYDGVTFDEGFRADLMVNNLVIIELKSLENIHPVHKKQLMTYLKLGEKKLGFLINFGAPLLKDGISRIANGVDDWGDRRGSR